MKLTANIGLLVILTTALLLPWTVTAQSQTDQFPAVHAFSHDVANGGTFLLEIDTGTLPPPDTQMRIDFNNRSYPVYRHPAGGAGRYFALIGIPYRTQAGPQKLTLNYSDAAGNKIRQIQFQVVAGKYKTDILKVDARRVNPNKEDRQRAGREAQEIQHVYATGTNERLWDGSAAGRK